MYKLLLLTVATSLLLGCSKKDNPNAQQTFSIIGKWSIVADTSRQYVSGVLNSTYIVVGINAPYYLFNADGSGTLKQNTSPPDQIKNFTYTVSKDTLTVNYPIQAA